MANTLNKYKINNNEEKKNYMNLKKLKPVGLKSKVLL